MPYASNVCRFLFAGFVGLVIGCHAPNDSICANGLLCPSGTVCVSEGASTQCATQRQIEACEGLSEGAECLLSGAGAGFCQGTLCVVAGCGDGVLEVGELCDDGNRESGDGCRGDCQKIEACGDAIVDEGEACDDANQNQADGCDQCVATEWVATTVTGGSVLATGTNLSRPVDVAISDLGDLYIADRNNHVIHRVDGANGTITIVAGNGNEGGAGDDGPATNAELNLPGGVAVDGLGNIYIADTWNHRIRRVDGGTGIITTVAGTGEPGFFGDNIPATKARLDSPSGVSVDGLGNVYIADTFNKRVRRVDTTTGKIITVIDSPTVGSPSGVATDGLGIIYIADSLRNVIHQVDTSNDTVTTVVTGALVNPGGVAVDLMGNLYIADTGNHRIQRVDRSTGVISTVAGDGTIGASGDDGPAVGAQLSFPTGVTVDGLGNIYVADNSNKRVRKVDATTGVITTFAGNTNSAAPGDGGLASSAPLSVPNGAAIDSLGHLFIADTSNNRIRQVDAATGVITTVAGNGTSGDSGDGTAASAAQLNRPWGVTVDDLGNLYIADTDNHRIRRVDASSGIITTVAGDGNPASPLNPGDGEVATNAQLKKPAAVTVDALGNLYIADTGTHRIRRVDSTTGVISTVAGDGNAADPLDPGDGGLATDAQLRSPAGVTLDGAGNLYIADKSTHRIRRVDIVIKLITTVAGDGTSGDLGDGAVATSAQLNGPLGVAVDATGNLTIADTWNNRIRRVDSVSGFISTIAGTGSEGASGDGELATDAEFNAPRGVAVNDLGDLYVADSNNDRIRRIDATSGLISSVAGRVAPEGLGAVMQAVFADPRALVLTPQFQLIAGGASGTVQALRANEDLIEVVAGRYPHATATSDRALYRSESFGSVTGIAHESLDNVDYIYISETEANQIHTVTATNPIDETTWVIDLLSSGEEGHQDGSLATAKFRAPAGLYFDDNADRVLYVADTGNHVIRAIDLDSATVTTFAGRPQVLGFLGDNGPARDALLFGPKALTRCPNGDFFVSDTGNRRVRRLTFDISTSEWIISTVLGVGVPASSGQGAPATTYPVNSPLGLACDAFGNLFVTSTEALRFLPADDDGIVDGTGPVQTIFGAPPRSTFPATVSACLTDVAIVNDFTVRLTDSCTGLLIELSRRPL